ncbi:MAG: hypothetical protein SGI71_02015 [Verrucomicrobiota bacterium]|nr:hypothetical protein [Verrucomicrobiota bacterium]
MKDAVSSKLLNGSGPSKKEAPRSPFTPVLRLATEHEQKKWYFILMIGSFIFCILSMLGAISLLTEKKFVFVVDGSNSIAAGPLESISELQSPVYRNTALLAATAAWQRSPVGFDLPELVRDVYAADALQTLNADMESKLDRYKVRNIHQKPEVSNIEVLSDKKGYRLVKVTGNLIQAGSYEGVAISDSIPFKMLLMIGSNPNLTRRGQYPFIVTDLRLKEGEK